MRYEELSLGDRLIEPAVIAAAGSTITDATLITKQFTIVTGADGAKGVRLGNSTNKYRRILNIGTGVLKVYPKSGSQINSLGASAAYNLGPGQEVILVGVSELLWYAPTTPSNQVLATEAGAGITGGTGTIYRSSVLQVGGIISTKILLDLTGLSSSTTDLDIIGQGASAAHIGQITAARNGTVLTGKCTCLEAPAGGVADIDIYAATEGTGVFDGGIAALTETALLTAGDTWTIGEEKIFTAMPAADAYLYLTGGAAGTAAAYTAGKFLIEMEGYAA